MMCTHLLESLSTITVDGDGQQEVIKAPPYDTKGLFLAATTQLFNEQCHQTKQKLNELLILILMINRANSRLSGKKCEIFDLIYEWCCGDSMMSRSIGTNLMSLYLPLEAKDTKVQVFSQPIWDILNVCERHLVAGSDETASTPLSAYLLANILQLFIILMKLQKDSSKVERTSKEYIFGKVIKSSRIAELLVHDNVSVRNKALDLFEKVLAYRLDYLKNGGGETIDTPPKARKRKKSAKTHQQSVQKDSSFEISAGDLRNILNNICELAKFDVREEILLISNLSLIYEICDSDTALSKQDISRYILFNNCLRHLHCY